MSLSLSLSMVALLLSSIASLNCLSLNQYSIAPRARSTSTRRLFEASSKDLIAPASFESDLYKILNVERTASTEEMKSAYRQLVFKNHPDRNNSIEALYIYQNVSHAYSILGRDPKRRQEYDRKLETQEFVGSIGNLTTEVSNIAGPLLNLTLRMAIPFVRDALDVSTAAFEALIEDPLEEETSGGFFTRITRSFGQKSLEQLIRRERNELESILKTLNQTQAELLVAMEAANQAKELFLASNATLNEKALEFQAISDEFGKASALLSECSLLESNARNEMKRREDEIRALTDRSSFLDTSISGLELEIIQLEELLRSKRSLLGDLKVEKSSVVESLSMNLTSTQVASYPVTLYFLNPLKC